MAPAASVITSHGCAALSAACRSPPAGTAIVCPVGGTKCVSKMMRGSSGSFGLPEGAETVTADVPDLPSLVAVIVAEPAACAETSPAPDTVAAAVFELDQVIVRFVRTLPFASFAVAVSCAVWPVVMSTVAGATVTVATGFWPALTVTLLLPLFPSHVAVMVALPDARPFTSPVDETDTTAGASLDHVTVRPVSTLLDAERTVAVSCDC